MENQNEKTKLCPAPVLARQLGVPVHWLKSEATAGRIPALKAENVFLFDPEIVIDLLAQRARKGAADGK